MNYLIATLFFLFGCLILTLTYFNNFTEPSGIRWLSIGLFATGLFVFMVELKKKSDEQDAKRST